MSKDPSYKVNSEQDYQQTLSALSQAKQPATILKLMMRGFEAYRAARKMGWSRPWNKYDLVNFQSLRIKPEQDHALIQQGLQLIDNEFTDIPPEARDFVHALTSDMNLMGFIFCHEFQQDGRRWEGATLSLGRKNNRRYRDRFDIILESEIIDAKSTGLSRIRVYVDPYTGKPAPPLWQAESTPQTDITSKLFNVLSEASWTWSVQTDRIWDHWTSRYIDYFGPRHFELTQSYFALAQLAPGRLYPEPNQQPDVA
ncbi:MAG: hypothetical protein OEX12_01850 [Gammaproteobacteria bacterium]|nr:hypothetical protein [Gammaproteobacteria bacterium]